MYPSRRGVGLRVLHRDAARRDGYIVVELSRGPAAQGLQGKVTDRPRAGKPELGGGGDAEGCPSAVDRGPEAWEDSNPTWVGEPGNTPWRPERVNTPEPAHDAGDVASSGTSGGAGARDGVSGGGGAFMRCRRTGGGIARAGAGRPATATRRRHSTGSAVRRPRPRDRPRVSAASATGWVSLRSAPPGPGPPAAAPGAPGDRDWPGVRSAGSW